MSEPSPAPSVGVMLGDAGPCPEVVHRGKVWKVGHPTQNAKAELERLAVQVAAQAIYDLEGVLPPAQFKKASDTFVRSVSAKSYKTWGAGWQEVVLKDENVHLFLLALLREKQPEATEEVARTLLGECSLAVSLAFAQVLPDFMRLLLLERKDLTPGQREELVGLVAGRLTEVVSRQQSPTPASEST